MSAAKQRLDDADARLASLEAPLADLTESASGARVLLADDERLERISTRIAEISASARHALDGVEGRAASIPVTAPRSTPELGVVHRAEATGYVAVYFDGGMTDEITLLVGQSDPPSEVVGVANSAADLHSYVGAVVRRGEYWRVASRNEDRAQRGAGDSGFVCVFTPFA